jgi:lysophospholipase L1-like esterase
VTSLELAKRLGLSIASVALLLLVVEGGVRLAVPRVSRVNFTPLPISLRSKSDLPDVPYRLRPGGVGTHRFGSDPDGYFDAGAKLTYRINSLGFRGPETTLEKPPGVFRIVGIGDSFTFGIGVRSRDTFLGVLQRRLDAAFGGGAYEVLNLGASGYDTAAEVSLLEHFGLQLEPDVVVLVFFPNDTGGGAAAVAFNASTPAERQPWWRARLRLVDLLMSRHERQQAVDGLVASYRASFREGHPGWKRARRSLVRAKRLLDRRDATLVLVIFPVLWELSDDHPFARIHETVAAFAEGVGIPVLDLLPAFRGHRGPELWAHPNNQHPNARAHAIAGDALFAFLKERGLLGE